MTTQNRQPPIDLTRFAERLAETQRDQTTLLRNLFKSVNITSEDNRSVRLHVVLADGNGRPQIGQLIRQLCNMTLDYCIPRKHKDKAIEHWETTNSGQRINALLNEARKLFTDIRNSGEGGELLLFILTESILGYPQAISKMALKTSSRMHYHGLDGIYISCSGSPPRLRLHFGESKLREDPSSSVREAVKSISTMLSDEGFLNGARRDYFLLNTQVDLGDEQLEEALKGFLDPIDDRYLAPEICAILLAGHELQNYPVVEAENPLPNDLIERANGLKDVLSRSATACGIDAFHIDMFLVPFPNIQSFRDDLITELGV